MHLKQVSEERAWGHYGLNFILANDEATVTAMAILMEMRNRITPMWRKVLKRELAQRMRIRRRRAEERRRHIFK